MRTALSCSIVAASVLALLPARGAAQIRGSEAAVVGQTIDGTTLTIEYSRPRAAGRGLFGELVPYGRPWTGANWATTLEADRSVRLNGIEIPAGRYSVWWIPEDGLWTLLLDPRHRLWHTQQPAPSPDQIRLQVEPREAPHSEMLTWTFPAVTGDAATLEMRWGTTALSIQVVVQPTRPVALDADEIATFTGTWDLELMARSGWPDSARFEVFEEGGLLRGRLPFPLHPGDELVFDLMPAGRHRFSPGLYRDGTLFNVEMGGTWEFDVEDGRAATVTLRGLSGAVIASGRRAGG